MVSLDRKEVFTMTNQELSKLLEECLNETIKDNSLILTRILNDPELRDENYKEVLNVIDSSIMAAIMRKNAEISIITTLKILGKLGKL